VRYNEASGLGKLGLRLFTHANGYDAEMIFPRRRRPRRVESKRRKLNWGFLIGLVGVAIAALSLWYAEFRDVDEVSFTLVALDGVVPGGTSPPYVLRGLFTNQGTNPLDVMQVTFVVSELSDGRRYDQRRMKCPVRPEVPIKVPAQGSQAVSIEFPCTYVHDSLKGWMRDFIKRTSRDDQADSLEATGPAYVSVLFHFVGEDGILREACLPIAEISLNHINSFFGWSEYTRIHQASEVSLSHARAVQDDMELLWIWNPESESDGRYERIVDGDSIKVVPWTGTSEIYSGDSEN